jgi:radical SAM protein with 4Fe4S-binding SPASM domain
VAHKFRQRVRRLIESLLLREAALVRRALLAAGRDRARRLPDIVQIEATNLCNAKCTFCPRDDMKRPQGFMDMALYQKIVDQCAGLGIRHVRMHNYGEAFLDKRLPEKIAYAKQRGIAEVGVITNGSVLGPEVARAVIEAGLDAINISLDAAGRETFESTRLGLKYDRVMANLEGFISIRRDLGRRRPKLILSFVRQGDSAEEQAFIDRWSAVADKIHITEPHNWAGTLDQVSSVRFPCYRQWLSFTVLWDGRVSLCCADFDGRVVLGDLRTQTIEQIWHSEAYQRTRREHLTSGGPEICRSCNLPAKDSPLWIRQLF